MEIQKIIRSIKRRFYSQKQKDASVKQRFLVDIIGTQAFSGLTLQDKIVSLAKLITNFHCDFNMKPRKLEAILLQFNNRSRQS